MPEVLYKDLWSKSDQQSYPEEDIALYNAHLSGKICPPEKSDTSVMGVTDLSMDLNQTVQEIISPGTVNQILCS